MLALSGASRVPPVPFQLLTRARALHLDARTGAISGEISWQDLDEEYQAKVQEAQVLRFNVTARNLAGKAKTMLRMLLLRTPGELQLRHSEVTYEVGKGKMAFSKELLENEAAKGWRPLAFGPIDIKRTEESNGPVSEFFKGSTFVWPERIPERDTPCVAGQIVNIQGRWPLFQITPDLPQGLKFDASTGEITGVPQQEVEGDWKVMVSNPAGHNSLVLHMRIMSPPSDFTYDYDEAVLIRGRDIGENTCEVKGTNPMRFMAEDSLPTGMKIDGTSGTISGIPDQLDTDSVTYTMLVANDVGQSSCKLKLLVSSPPPESDGTQGSGKSIINLEVEARVGQRVEATADYIAHRKRLGLVDVSATNPRNAQDLIRSGKLQLQSWEMAGQPRGAQRSDGEMGDLCAEAGALHETAAGRGTIVNVFDYGNSCQVRWDATGLVSTYDTGRNNNFTLQTWGSDIQLRKHYDVLPVHVRETLHDDLDWLLDEFLAEFNALTPLQHAGFHKTTKHKLVGPAHKHTKSGTPDDLCPQGSGLMQRLIHELDGGWLSKYKVFKDASLWMAIQIPDRKVNMKVDWDPYIRYTFGPALPIKHSPTFTIPLSVSVSSVPAAPVLVRWSTCFINRHSLPPHPPAPPLGSLGLLRPRYFSLTSLPCIRLRPLLPSLPSHTHARVLSIFSAVSWSSSSVGISFEQRIRVRGGRERGRRMSGGIAPPPIHQMYV